MGRPELPEVPQNATECRALLLKELCKTDSDTTKVNGWKAGLASFEAEEQRVRQDVIDAEQNHLKELSATASLKSSEDWRAAQTIVIRAELQDELNAANLCRDFEAKQKTAQLQNQLLTLQEKVDTLQAANTAQGAEITALRSNLATANEHLQALRQDNETLAAQLAPVDPAVLQAEIDKLKAEKIPQVLSERLKNSTRMLFLHTQLMRIAQGERIRQFEQELAGKEAEWKSL